MNTRYQNLIVSLLAMFSACTVAIAQTIEAYPSKPIRLIVPYTPGGSIDNTGRLVADQLQRQLGQAIVVENLPGASGLVGSMVAMKAKPDGYTLIFNASSHAYLPLVVSKKTYDVTKDFTPIGQIGYVPLLVVVNNSVPAKNLAELAQLAKENPGKYAWATSGLGTTSHLSEELFNRRLSTGMDIITYKGAVPQLTDVIGGHVSAAVSPMPGVFPFVKAGRLKVIGVTSKTRLPNLPDVPTVSESAIPGYELLSWYGIWAPANTPMHIVNRLNAEIGKAVDSPNLRAKFQELSFIPNHSSHEEFKKFIQDDLAKIGKVIQDANIKIDP